MSVLAAEDVMKRDHGLLRQCLVYTCIIGVAITGISLGSIGAALVLMTVMNLPLEIPEQMQEGRTRLDQKMEDSREIRGALAKQLPPPEPLPRVTAHVRSARTRVASPQSTAIHRNRIKARNAFAGIAPAQASPLVSAYAESDRHTVK